MARWIHTNGTEQEVHPKQGETFTLEEMKAFVGGYLEAIRLNETEVLYLNENGLALRLPPNTLAMKVLSAARKEYMGVLLVGNVLIATLYETGDDEE